MSRRGGGPGHAYLGGPGHAYLVNSTREAIWQSNKVHVGLASIGRIVKRHKQCSDG